MKTAVGAPAPVPTPDEILERFANMSVAEFLAFQKKLKERQQRRKLS